MKKVAKLYVSQLNILRGWPGMMVDPSVQKFEMIILKETLTMRIRMNC